VSRFRNKEAKLDYQLTEMQMRITKNVIEIFLIGALIVFIALWRTLANQ